MIYKIRALFCLVAASCSHEHQSTFLVYNIENRGEMEIWATPPRIGAVTNWLSQKEKYSMTENEIVYFPEEVSVMAKGGHVTVSSPKASYNISEATNYGLDVHASYPEGFKLYKINQVYKNSPSDTINVSG